MNLAVKVPDDLHLKILSFPFLHALNRYFMDTLEENETFNFHLISQKENLDVLNMLPFKAYYQTIHVEDANNPFAAHRNLGNLNKADVEVYFSLTETFTDAMIGKNLKAKKRIGFSVTKNNLLFHKKIKDLGFEHYSQKIFSLLKGIDKCDSKLKKVTSRKVDPLYKDHLESPYTVINIEVKNDELDAEWADLIDLFVGQKFVFMASGLALDRKKEALETFKNKLTKKNEYDFYLEENLIDFGKLVSYADCFVSGDSPFVQYASYCGTQVFHLNREDGEYYDNRFFIGDTVRCSSKDDYYKDGEEFHYGKFFDEVHSFIESKVKHREVN